MARTQHLGIQINTSTVYESHHPPVASSSLPIILVHKRLRSNGTSLCCELACLRVAILSNLGRVYQREPDSSDVKCISINDVSHGIRKAWGWPFSMVVGRAKVGGGRVI